MKKSASEWFNTPGHPYNCAQAIAIAAADGDVSVAESWRPFGGGRAPEGLCGALYAALQAMPENARDAAIESFRQKAGAVTCREIKGSPSPTPCSQCVAIAEAILMDVKAPI